MAMDADIEDRRRGIAEAVAQKGFVDLSELVRRFGVSESTLRRDLDVLDEQGALKRTRGGAAFVNDSAQPLAFAERESTAAAEKAKIAQAVAGLIEPEQTLLINGGTTCYQVARRLAGRRLSVVTNSVPIAGVLMGEQQTEVTLIGGYLYPRTGVSLGELALRMLDDIHCDVLVMSCAGVCGDSAYNVNQMIVEMDQRLMRSAGRSILAIDHNKIGKRSLSRLCRVADFDVIVTDDGVADEQLAALEAGGARQVVVAR